MESLGNDLAMHLATTRWQCDSANHFAGKQYSGLSHPGGFVVYRAALTGPRPWSCLAPE